MRAYFDLSTLGPWNRAAHQRAWEEFLARASTADSELTVTSEASTADVIIETGSPGSFDSRLSSMLRPITRSDVERIVWDWGDAPLGRLSGFYCSLNSRLFDLRRHRTMSYPIVFNDFIEDYPQDDATHDFSFVGGITAGVRTRIVKAFGANGNRHNAFVRVQPASWTTILDGTDVEIKRNFAESLRKAKFVLCPRGAGVGSVRVFETMKAGRVPVIISDGYVLPSGIDWSGCSLVVREADIEQVPGIIASRAGEWSEMAKRSRQVWEANFSDQCVLSYLGTQLAELGAARPDVNSGFRAAYAARVAGVLVEQRLRPIAGSIRQIAGRKEH